MPETCRHADFRTNHKKVAQKSKIILEISLKKPFNRNFLHGIIALSQAPLGSRLWAISMARKPIAKRTVIWGGASSAAKAVLTTRARRDNSSIGFAALQGKLAQKAFTR